MPSSIRVGVGVGIALLLCASVSHAQRVNVTTEAARLVGADVDAATAAAQALGKTKTPAALDALLDALALGLHPKAATAALDALAAHADIKAFDTAAFYLSYRDARVRAAAVRAVGALDDARAVNLVLARMRDGNKDVRAAAIGVVQARKLKQGIEPLMALLIKGDEAVAPALAAMADRDLVIALGEQLGAAPDDVLARTLGLVLLRKDFGPEQLRVEVVNTLGKVPGTEAIQQLNNYIESIPEKPPRLSRRVAETIWNQRLLSGGE